MSDLAIAAAEAQSPDDVESGAPGRTWNFDLIITPIAMGLLLVLLVTVWQFADMDVTTKKILSPANLRIQTWQHLQITFWSTLLVISIAIPLGIFITREGFKKFPGRSSRSPTPGRPFRLTACWCCLRPGSARACAPSSSP